MDGDSAGGWINSWEVAKKLLKLIGKEISEMDSRTSLIYYLLESRLVKSPREDSSASSCNGRHPNDIQKNDDKQESHHLTVSDLGQKRPDHFPSQRWGDK